jgi:hypothetical protein
MKPFRLPPSPLPYEKRRTKRTEVQRSAVVPGGCATLFPSLPSYPMMRVCTLAVAGTHTVGYCPVQAQSARGRRYCTPYSTDPPLCSLHMTVQYSTVQYSTQNHARPRGQSYHEQPRSIFSPLSVQLACTARRLDLARRRTRRAWMTDGQAGSQDDEGRDR